MIYDIRVSSTKEGKLQEGGQHTGQGVCQGRWQGMQQGQGQGIQQGRAGSM